MIDHDNEDHEHARAAEHHAACASNPGLDGEADAILTAPDSDVDAELRRLGVDPVAVGERGEAFVEATTLYEAAFKSMRPVDFGSAKARHAIVPRIAEALSGRDTELRALREVAEAAEAVAACPAYDDLWRVYEVDEHDLLALRAALAKVRP